MGNLSRMLMASITCLAGAAFSQIITFNGPNPWSTLRNDSIVVRAQVDTSQVKQKEFAVTVDLVNDRAQKKPLLKKSFPIKDYTEEFALGTVKQNLIGGRSYLKIGWSLPGTESKGTIAPVGIAALNKLPPAEAVSAAKIQDGADIAAVVAGTNNADFHTAGNAKFAFAWNKQALFIVLMKSKTTGNVRFGFDGKNGKNAFLSFSDRFVAYSGANDSVQGVRFPHQLNGDTLKYPGKPWQNEISKSVIGDKVGVRVPWYDLGINPFEGRRLGLGVMTFDEKGNQTAALPKSADFYCPGTWTDLQLAK